LNFVLQPYARGTGDAVLCAREQMRDFAGHALVVWATQPVLRAESVKRAVKLAVLFPEYKMIVPTAMMERPYAPIERDPLGRVESAHETHLERVKVSDFGESNIGLFLLRKEAMFHELETLHRELWREVEMRYDRPRGELGFPNELIRRLAGRAGGVLAVPIGDWREEKGIKTKSDVQLCERYVSEIG
jgi:bifunctional N-acetylglucosamine-1-phosphate-uridyltransferase/glucosamine-1-phosphate-acetyltransferase GlmU-like protein